MDMKMHDIALDGTCGQSGSETHEKEPKTVHKFLLFITYPIKQRGETKSLGTVAYHRPTTLSPDGVV